MKRIISVGIPILMMLAVVAVVSPAAAMWELSAPSAIVFECGSGNYAHTLNTVSQNTNGTFTGTGTYDANASYTWDIDGEINGDAITFAIVYTGANLGYTLNGVGTIASDGSISGTVDGNCQTFEMPSSTSSFDRSAEITSPASGEEVSGTVDFTATLNDKDDNDSVQWAVRKGTCAANSGTVLGNVDGHSDSYTWDGESFAASADVSGWDLGDYCFIFNPTESSGDTAIRETRWFKVVEEVEEPEYKNHGQYVRSQENKREAAQSRVGMPEKSKGHTK